MKSSHESRESRKHEKYAAPAAVSFDNLAFRPKGGVTKATKKKPSVRAESVLRAVEKERKEQERKEEENESRGVDESSTEEEQETSGSEAGDFSRLGFSLRMRKEGLRNMRKMWRADPKDVLDPTLVPKGQVNGEWVPKDSIKWEQELLHNLGQLSRYCGHEEANRRLLAQRDLRMTRWRQEGARFLSLRWHDAQHVMYYCAMEGRKPADVPGSGKYF